MNQDINTMIELQHLWDNVLKGREDVRRGAFALAAWEKRVQEAGDSVAKKEQDIRNLKAEIKTKELDLALRDEQMKKLEARRGSLRSEKEVTALEHELDAVKSDRGNLEEFLIEKMDVLQASENDIIILQKEFDEVSRQYKLDKMGLEKVIAEAEQYAEANSLLFKELLARLSPQYQSKFSKIINSKDGKAIVKLDGENCSGCNFKIPSHLAVEAAKNDKIVNCTNCGRFVYT